MTWMMLIMALPVIGLALFYIWPLSSALPTYLILLGFSVLFHTLMRTSMKLPEASGAEELIGLPVTVLSWKGGSGQVRVHGEIWRGRSRNGTSVRQSEDLHVAGVEGLTLVLEPRVKAAEDSAPQGTNGAASKVKQRGAAHDTKAIA